MKRVKIIAIVAKPARQRNPTELVIKVCPHRGHAFAVLAHIAPQVGQEVIAMRNKVPFSE